MATSGAPAVAAILPGSNRAILTLANGQQIPLNSVQKGILSQQGNTKVIKLDSGRLAYTASGDGGGGDGVARGGVAGDGVAGDGVARDGVARDGVARGGAGGADSKAVLYNTITTPRGGQYQVTLADGTRVWLNAESSLRFPTAFTGKEREVVLTGEAYLEVVADKDHPFVVRAGPAVTRVLGTQLDIMAYGDEGAVKATLLTGAVSMGQASKSVLLHPGEQGQYDDGKGVIATRSVNTRAVVAWKDGYYFFDRTPVQSVMRQIARWYDVEIVYEGAVPKDEIVGRIPRTAYVSEVLHIMELIGIHFKIDGKKIIVLN
jgi:transmembrane sensor